MRPKPQAFHRFTPPSSLLSLFCAVALTACGGGGSAPEASPASATPVATVPPAADSAVVVAPPAEAAAAVNASIRPDMTALSVPSNLVLDGGSASATTWASQAPADTEQRTYFVDSAAGDDSLDGLAATAAGAGRGPWRSLQRLGKASLQAGDRVVLACGSVWRETLKLSAVGTASQPIVVGLPTKGCSTAPLIDGGVEVPASAWTAVKPGVYETPFASQPLQLQDSQAVRPWAHHPNRGHDAQRPQSPYLATAGNGNTTFANGAVRSTSFVSGSDLQLPAEATSLVGTTVRLRTNAWTLEERRITASAGNQHTLDSPTAYPTTLGWGYYLLGQPWMVDTAGEWAWDATRQRLVAHWGNAGAPALPLYATVLDTGLDLRNTAHLLVEGLKVRRVGVGARLAGSQHVHLRAMQIEDTAAHGVLVSGSSDTRLTSNLFNRTGKDAVLGVGEAATDALRLVATQNTVLNSGVVMQGEDIVSLPSANFAAIYAGNQATVSDNVVINSGYIGIRFGPGSTLERNTVFGSCSVIDDCGGLYTWGTAPNNSVLRQNIVIRARGNVNGKPEGASTAAQGLYLDDGTSGVLLEGNTVADADHGLQLHNAYNNTVRQNRLYANRRSQMWLQEDRNTQNAAGDLYGNLIENNHLAPAHSSAVGLWLDTIYTTTAQFGRFNGNRFLDALSAAPVFVRTSQGNRALSTAQWQASTGLGSTLPVDAGGFSQRSQPFTYFTVGGSNLVNNAQFSAGLNGWTHWNQTAPSGNLLRETCAAGTCARYAPGGSAGLVSSPNFSVQQGQWYRLSVDLRADTDAQPVAVVVRRGGGGNNGYEVLADRSISFNAGTAWQRFSVVFQATKTVLRADPATGDLGARVDFADLVTGKSLSLANLELLPITPDLVSLSIGAVVNASANARALPCPVTGTASSVCSRLNGLSSLQGASWPLNTAAYSSELLFTQLPELADTDRDGIADSQDQCPGTPLGTGTNGKGCGWGQ